MRLDHACKPAFARHETFHPRYGWVKKAYDAAARDPNTFNAADAVVLLGVGKNMVRSIRYWGLAYRILSQTKSNQGRIPLASPSVLGRVMFGDDGWDPYCEQIDTQWLLHWWLLAPESLAPVWWLAFNEFPAVEFTDEQLEEFVIDRVRDWADPHPSSVKKDVSCLLRMYATGGDRGPGAFDELIDSPTRDLGLLVAGADRGTYRFALGAKPSLSPSVAAFACLDFVSRLESDARTMTLSRLATEPGSPGRAFKLTEAALGDLIERACAEHDDIELVSQAGMPQLVFHDEPGAVGSDLLYEHYRALLGQVRWHGAARIAGPRGSQAIESASSGARQR